jgi:hypothetical protein
LADVPSWHNAKSVNVRSCAAVEGIADINLPADLAARVADLTITAMVRSATAALTTAGEMAGGVAGDRSKNSGSGKL